MAADRTVVTTDRAPAPAGAYSQAVGGGGLVFVAGQVPRRPDGTTVTGPFEEQCRQVLDNVEAIARAAGTSLAAALKVNVYLRDTGDRAAFDAIYRGYVADEPPARCIVQSDLPGFALEVEAVLLAPATAGA